MNPEKPSMETTPERVVKTEELKINERYTLYNSLEIPGEKNTISIEAGTDFIVLPAVEKTTRNIPEQQGVYYILDFNGVRITVSKDQLNTCYITEHKEQE